MKPGNKLFFFLFAFLFSQQCFYLCAGTQVLFSPADRPAERLIERIDNAKKRIYAAVYMLTEKRVAQALARAKQRKVDVRLVLDRISLESPWGKADIIEESGAKIWLKNPPKSSRRAKIQGPSSAASTQSLTAAFADEQKPEKTKNNGYKAKPIMHNKYAIIDDTIWTGSLNWTVSANTRNDENVVVISGERETLSRFLANFNDLAAASEKVTAQDIQEMRKESLSGPTRSKKLQAKSKHSKPQHSKKPSIWGNFGWTPGQIDFDQA